jgi:hypothetical protein
MTAQEESLKDTIKKMREAKTPREYASAIVEHFNKFKTPVLVGSKIPDLDVLNAPLLKKLGDLDS